MTSLSSPMLITRLLLVFIGLFCTLAKFISNNAIIPPQSGIVEAKFVYDRSLVWSKKPGLFSFNLKTELRPEDELYVTLFDDQWESFPQASAVWEEASCEEKLSTARWSVRALPEWTNRPEGFNMDVNVTQKTRPRTWYAAVVSCADHPIKYSMDSRMVNPLRGVLSEFSYDEMWHLPLSVIYVGFYGIAYFFFASSLSSASPNFIKTAPEGARNLWRLLGVSLMFSCLGASLQMVHYFQYMFDGVGFEFLMSVASLLLYASKGAAMNLLLLLSRGELFAKEARSLFATASSLPAHEEEGYGGLGSNSSSFQGGKFGSAYVDDGDLEVASAFEAPNKVFYKMARMSGYAKYFISIAVWVVACWALEMWGAYSYRARFTPDLPHETTMGQMIVLADVVLCVFFCVKTFETVGKDKNEVRKLYYKKWTMLLAFVFVPVPAALVSSLLFGHWIKACVFFAVFHYVTVLSLILLSIAISPAELEQPLAAAKDDYESVGTGSKNTRNVDRVIGNQNSVPFDDDDELEGQLYCDDEDEHIQQQQDEEVDDYFDNHKQQQQQKHISFDPSDALKGSVNKSLELISKAADSVQAFVPQNLQSSFGNGLETAKGVVQLGKEVIKNEVELVTPVAVKETISQVLQSTNALAANITQSASASSLFLYNNNAEDQSVKQMSVKASTATVLPPTIPTPSASSVFIPSALNEGSSLLSKSKLQDKQMNVLDEDDNLMFSNDKNDFLTQSGVSFGAVSSPFFTASTVTKKITMQQNEQNEKVETSNNNNNSNISLVVKHNSSAVDSTLLPSNSFNNEAVSAVSFGSNLAKNESNESRMASIQSVSTVKKEDTHSFERDFFTSDDAQQNGILNKTIPSNVLKTQNLVEQPVDVDKGLKSTAGSSHQSKTIAAMSFLDEDDMFNL